MVLFTANEDGVGVVEREGVVTTLVPAKECSIL